MKAGGGTEGGRSRKFDTLRHLRVGGASLPAVLAVFLLQEPVNHQFHEWWGWSHYHYGNDLFTKRFVAGLLPLPFAFVLWLRVLERDGRLALRFSPAVAGLTTSAFIAAPLLHRDPQWLEAAFATGVLSGLFVFVPFSSWLRRAARHPRLACVALLACSSAWDYYWLMGHMASHAVLYWTGKAVAALLGGLGVETFVDENLDYPLAFTVLSHHFKIILAPFCGGLEGVFLFTCVLSMAFLAEWDRLGRGGLPLTYGLGVVAMFGVNVGVPIATEKKTTILTDTFVQTTDEAAVRRSGK